MKLPRAFIAPGPGLSLLQSTQNTELIESTQHNRVHEFDTGERKGQSAALTGARQKS